MDDKHFLLKSAYVYKGKDKLDELPGCTFSEADGLWVVRSTGEPLVTSQAPNSYYNGTKKNDIETGEDQKGD